MSPRIILAAAALFMLSACNQEAAETFDNEPKAPAYWLENADKIPAALEACEKGKMSAEACAMVYRAKRVQDLRNGSLSAKVEL